MSWSSFHASHAIRLLKALNSLLPLFPEKSEDPAMIKHALNLIKMITSYLNGDQCPVVCGDQPTYALIKNIQWHWPELYGEEAFVALLGPLHIEKAFLRVLGQYLESSGWCSVVANSGIASIGSAEGFLKARVQKVLCLYILGGGGGAADEINTSRKAFCRQVSHIMKARAAHQKTAVALYSLLYDAYEAASDVDAIPLQEWAEEKAKQLPTFKFWFNLLNLEIILLTFVKSVREGSFDLYKKSLKNMVPYFFSMNHPQYARWLPIHIRDMETLEDACPEIYQQFMAGKEVFVPRTHVQNIHFFINVCFNVTSHVINS